MESVTTHELGHAHQLNHVIEENDIMHRAIGNGDKKRELSYNNRRAGKYVQAQSVTTKACGPGPMTNFPGCDPSLGLPKMQADNVSFRIYPNPATEYIEVVFSERDSEFVHLDVIDVVGKVLISRDILQQNLRIPTLELPGGMYLIQVYNKENKVHSTKFVVDKSH